MLVRHFGRTRFWPRRLPKIFSAGNDDSPYAAAGADSPDPLNTQFDVSLSSAFPVQLSSNGSRTARAMPKRILVADDSAMIRKCLCRIFEIEEDYDICAEAVNGEEAIALAKQHKPDLIVLDYQMPMMNGIEAAYELKRIMPDVPIILFTLHAVTMKYSMGQDSPVDLVVAKSDAVHIVDHIRSLIPV
jgi:CheY-like chemotaxis protein